MKLYVLDLGKIIMVGDNPVTDSAQSGAEPLSIPIHAFLVDSPIGYILFDTGCNPEGMAGAWPEALRANPYVAAPEQQLLRRLAQLGLKPADISVVVLSHLHLDHAGGAHFFPRPRSTSSRKNWSGSSATTPPIRWTCSTSNAMRKTGRRPAFNGRPSHGRRRPSPYATASPF